LPSATSSQPSQICSYANINTRFAHPLCAYRNRVTRLKQSAFAMWKRARACPRCRVTRTSLAPMPMVSARCTPHFRSNNSRRVRKSLSALTVLPGRGASISVAPSIHRTPRKRSVSATYCEPKNGLRWAANATLAPIKEVASLKSLTVAPDQYPVEQVKALSLDQSPVKWCPGAKP